MEEDAEDVMRQRISQRILASGMTRKQVAEKMGTSQANVSRVLGEDPERNRSLSLDWIRKFSKALGCRMRDIMVAPITVPVIGYVGAGEMVENFDDRGELDRVEAPDGLDDAVAVIVRGESMWPKYEDGQLLYFRPSDHIAPDCLGRVCVVQVKEGPTLVKRVKADPARPGRYRLISTRAPEMEGVELIWAARVRWAEEP